MNVKRVLMALAIGLAIVSDVAAQDLFAQGLGSSFRKVKDGIYVFVGKVRVPPDPERDSNVGVIVTQDGVVLIDTGENPFEARKVQAEIKKLTTQPVKFIILTEPHLDHYTGSFLYPGATVITQGPGIRSMQLNAKGNDPGRLQAVIKEHGEEGRKAGEGYKFVIPQVAMDESMTLQVGERTLELMHMKDIHSEGDIAIWLPNERVLFSAGGLVPDQFPILRTFVTVPDLFDAADKLTALNPEIVIPGHGIPGTVKIFEDSRKYWLTLLDRVAGMIMAGKNLATIQKEIKLPEYDHFGSKNRFGGNVEMAFMAICSPRAVYRIYGNDRSKDGWAGGGPCRIRP